MYTVTLGWALDGHGTQGSTWEIAEHLRDGTLTPLLRDWALPAADFYAIYLERHRLSAKLRAFIDFLGDRFSGGFLNRI
jgi:LysR family transcriptional regulator, transcriptional activator for dmlA